MVFIPCAGSTSYDSAKIFRPITLPFFLLRTQERLIDRQIREDVVVTIPLYAFQNTYQTGKLTKIAFQFLVFRIKKALYQKTNLPSGHFWISMEPLTKHRSTPLFVHCTSLPYSLWDRNIFPAVVNSMRSILSKRGVTVNLNEICVRATVGRGCLLRRINKKKLFTQDMLTTS